MKFTAVASAAALVLIQGAESCLQMAKYTACTSAAANKMAACNSMVVDVPTYAFWDCVCSGQNALVQCYSNCPDDVNMQLQYQSQMANEQSTCVYVDQLKAEGKDAPPVSKKTTVGIVGTDGKVMIPVARGQPPPLDQGAGSNSTTTDGSGAGIILGSGAAPVSTAFVGGQVALVALVGGMLACL